MTNPVDEWMTAPAPPADATTERLMKHEWGWHTDDPDDECPACRVDRGIALLDERRPGWWEDVDMDDLWMANECRCVLGQTFRDYFDGLAGLGLTWIGDAPWQNGFDLRWRFDGTCDESYDVLNTIWRRRISERRAR